MKRLHAGLLALLFVPPTTISALAQQAPAPSDQQQGTSLGDVARAAREQKKAQPKPGKVWDNESIAQSGGQINVVGPAPAAAAAPEVAPEKPAPAEDRATLEKQLADAKGQLATLKTDLDIMQRKYTLDQQTFYSKTDYSSDKAGAAALDEEKSQIDAKQQEVADAQKKVDDLQGKLDELSGEGGGKQPM